MLGYLKHMCYQTCVFEIPSICDDLKVGWGTWPLQVWRGGAVGDGSRRPRTSCRARARQVGCGERPPVGMGGEGTAGLELRLAQHGLLLAGLTSRSGARQSGSALRGAWRQGSGGAV